MYAIFAFKCTSLQFVQENISVFHLKKQKHMLFICKFIKLVRGKMEC